MTFGIHDKAPNVIRWLRLIIHQRKGWICIMTYVKRILIFEVNISLQRQQDKEKWWIVDVDPRFLKPSNTFWACKIPFFHSHKP
jgi:hypothetical protein